MSKENKRLSGLNIASIILWAIIGILVVVIIIEAIIVFTKGDHEEPNASASPSISATADTTASADSTQTPSSTATATPTGSSGATATSGQNTIKPTPSNTPAQGGTTTGDLTEAKIIDPSSIDFSFLNSKSKEAFEDCAAGSFDWYPGLVERNADGKITYHWDRYASTLSVLNANHGIYRKNTDQNVLYLTFDCGYEYGYTTKILDTLKEKNVKAIFFVTGGFVNDSSNHPLLKRMYNEGHLIGSHTENHKVMPTVSNEEFVKEMNTVYQTCKNILGNDFTMAYYRPPQGASCERDLALASYLGYNTVFWSATHADYNVDKQPDPAKALAEIKSRIHPGAVYLLHAISSTNAAILGDFIDYARAEGFEFRRMDK